MHALACVPPETPVVVVVKKETMDKKRTVGLGAKENRNVRNRPFSWIDDQA